MAKQPTPIFDFILVVFLILAALLGIWVYEPELLPKICSALPILVQRVLDCR